MIEMLMTTVEMSASDTARQWVVAQNATNAIDGLKYTIDIDRIIEMLNATVAMTAMNTEFDDCKKKWSLGLSLATPMALTLMLAPAMALAMALMPTLAVVVQARLCRRQWRVAGAGADAGANAGSYAGADAGADACADAGASTDAGAGTGADASADADTSADADAGASADADASVGANADTNASAHASDCGVCVEMW